MIAECKFCPWQEKKSGVYEAHYAARQHLKNEHLELFQEMNREELAIRMLQSELSTRFGLAVRPLGMNL